MESPQCIHFEGFSFSGNKMIKIVFVADIIQDL